MKRRMTSTHSLSRRRMISSTAALGGLTLLGLSGAGIAMQAGKTAPKITMYRDPNCGCCSKWATAARAAGFDVTVSETSDIMGVKAKLGVPDTLMSCHTSVAGGYVIEGHVPLNAVKKLLSQKPKIRGIAVPGMPLGSPGMEVPGRAAQPFDVIAFDAAGNTRKFS